MTKTTHLSFTAKKRRAKQVPKKVRAQRKDKPFERTQVVNLEEVPAVPEVNKFIEEWNAVVPDDIVATFSVDPRTNTVDINSFYVTSKVKGVGSLAMQKMVDLADKYDVTLRGIPSPKKTQFREPMTKDQLIRYYERFGFKVEIVNGVESIVREPIPKPPAVEVKRR